MRTILAKLPAATRVLLGLVFFVFGLNGFLHFLPQPPMTGRPAELLGAFVAAGYMIPLIKATEVVAGLLLLTGRFVPLALTLLAPIIVQIAAFHLFLAPGGLGLVAVVLLAELYLSWAYRDAFAPMLRANAKPRAPQPEAARAAVDALA